MFARHFYTIILLYMLLASCNNDTSNTSILASNEQQTVDTNFDNFIEKFSSDTAFQISRIKFPLKTKYYDVDNLKDSIFYQTKSNFELLDFRKKKANSQYDQWEQKIQLNKSKSSATIEIRGIDNGIIVDFLFEKTNNIWMLISVEDSST